MAVYLIAYTLTGFDFQLLGKGFITVGELLCIDHFIFAPATLLEHRPTLQAVGVSLDVFALTLVRDQDSVIRCHV